MLINNIPQNYGLYRKEHRTTKRTFKLFHVTEKFSTSTFIQENISMFFVLNGLLQCKILIHYLVYDATNDTHGLLFLRLHVLMFIHNLGL